MTEAEALIRRALPVTNLAGCCGEQQRPDSFDIIFHYSIGRLADMSTCQSYIGALLSHECTSSTPSLNLRISRHYVDDELIEPVSASDANRLVARIQSASGLTMAMVAPLVRVSRRTLQAWRAGSPINLKNEERLRALAEAIEAIADGKGAADVRTLLLDRQTGRLRIYDLLAEGQFALAYQRATGLRHRRLQDAARLNVPASSLSIETRLAAEIEVPTKSSAERNRAFIKRLKK